MGLVSSNPLNIKNIHEFEREALLRKCNYDPEEAFKQVRHGNLYFNNSTFIFIFFHFVYLIWNFKPLPTNSWNQKEDLNFLEIRRYQDESVRN